ncbi:MAG TPA: hypothetical protein VMW87_10710 [Spirochaetia bacterium]|nr:hypothetical protein [Spirochaetia bacterium]
MNTVERKAFAGHVGADGKSHDATGEAVAAGTVSVVTRFARCEVGASFSRRSLATNAPCSMVTKR